MSDDLAYLQGRLWLEARELRDAPRHAMEKLADVVGDLRGRDEGHDVDAATIRRITVDLADQGLEQLKQAFGRIRNGCSQLERLTAADVANEIAAHLDDALLDRRDLKRLPPLDEPEDG